MKFITLCSDVELAIFRDLLQQKIDNINANRSPMLQRLNWRLDLCSYQHNLNGFLVQAVVDDGSFSLFGPAVSFLFQFFTDEKEEQYILKGKVESEECEQVGWISLEDVSTFSAPYMFKQEQEMMLCE